MLLLMDSPDCISHACIRWMGSLLFHVAVFLYVSETKSVADPVNIRCGLELICAPLLSVLAASHRALREINEGFDLVLLCGKNANCPTQDFL